VFGEPRLLVVLVELTGEDDEFFVLVEVGVCGQLEGLVRRDIWGYHLEAGKKRR